MMPKRIPRWIYREIDAHKTALLAIVLVIQSFALTGILYLYVHKDDFRHCVTDYVGDAGIAQKPRAEASVKLQRANKNYIDHPDAATQLNFDLRWADYQNAVKRNPLPPLPPCLQK